MPSSACVECNEVYAASFLNLPYRLLKRTCTNPKKTLKAAILVTRPMIEDALAAFLQEGLGIHLGTRDEALGPNGARAVAVHVEPGGTHLIVYVAAVAAARLLPDLEANGQAAVSFGRPVDDRACQVKGEFVGARPASEAEQPLVLAQWNGFLTSLEQIGIPRAATRAWVTWPAVAIRLRAGAVFEQTPGPAAGARMEGA